MNDLWVKIHHVFHSFCRKILPSQTTVVMVSEMIHTASLVHDDVIDGADTRRGKTSVNKMFGERMSVLAADYILACASQALAKLGNSEVVELLARVVDDLVKGEYITISFDPDSPACTFIGNLKITFFKNFKKRD